MQPLSRRKFIKNGTLGSLGCVLAAKATGCGSLSSNNPKTIKFVHATDTHLDLGKPQTLDWMKMLVDKINNDVPNLDFVLFGGDNFNNNVPGKADAAKFKEIASKLKYPWYSVRGNKESSPKPKGDPLNQKDYAEIFFPADLKVARKDWSLEKGEYTILGIDTTIEQHGNGIFTPKSLDFVENELKAHPNRRFIILNHQPYWNFWRGTRKSDTHKYVLNNADEVKRRLFKYPNLVLTLSGHKHLDNIARFGHVAVISTVGFVVPQGPGKDHRFRVVEIAEDGTIRQMLAGIS